MRRKLFMAAGSNTLSMGSGRNEFHPKKPLPSMIDYVTETGRNSLAQIGNPHQVDEGVFGNFMASRYIRQAHLGALFPAIHDSFRHKPSLRVEGACASGGLALISGMRSVLAETADSVLVVGAEIQNSVKAIYGADILAGAGWEPDRKSGHAHYFPGCFSDRAGAYFQRYGKEKTRHAMASWYAQAIENARLCPSAQEYHNTHPDPLSLGMISPDPRVFTENLNVYDCSKVSDGASSIVLLSEKGLKRHKLSLQDTVEIVGFAQITDNLTEKPKDLTRLDTIAQASRQVIQKAGISLKDIALFEIHDCFTIAAILIIEAIGLATQGQGPEFILNGNTGRKGAFPMNTTGGLIGWGHPTGATGVHQAVTIWEQLTGKAGDAQIKTDPKRPYGMSINMGGDDKTAVVILYKQLQATS